MNSQATTQFDTQMLLARIGELEATLSDREKLLYNKEQQVQQLQEQISQLQNKQYGSSSERMLNPGQMEWDFFNEAELLAALNKSAQERAEQETPVKAHTRKGRQKKPLDENLPRVEVVHDLPEDQKQCHECGNELKVIDTQVTEQLAIIPQRYYVIRHKRYSYACNCKQCLKTAPMPTQPLPGTQASAVLLAYLIVAKHQDGLPLNRLEKIAARAGVDLAREKIARWIIRCSAMLQILFNLMQDAFLEYDIGHADETGLQVLKEPGRSPQNKSWLWIRRGGPPVVSLFKP